MVDHANPGSTNADGNSSSDPVIREAMDRFERCEKWESNARRLGLEDYKFFNADSDNGFQWPNELRKNRDIDARPCLTINKTRQHDLQIINDAKQNKPGVAIRPTGNGATYESAQILEGVVRHIEYQSNASVAYDTATTFQVTMGVGYIRVVTDYVDPHTFDQEIFIKRVDDPFTIYLDPDAKEADKSDMRYAFVFEDLPKKEFDKLYPKWKDKGTESPLGATTGWFTEETVRRAEYFRKVQKKDKLVSFTMPADQKQYTMMLSEIPQELRKSIMADPATQSRDTAEEIIEWYLILGEEVVEKKLFPGKFIPIIPVIGEETVIEGQMDRKGHTRAMKDPQRMYNYWTSSATEFVALQGKSPWIASAESIEGYESYWNTANKVNHSVLAYNGFMDDGVTPIAPPQKPQPPMMAPAYMQGMQVAGQEIMEVSGQYQPMMGEPSNERSGKAIQERQRQGENSTYHYIDNLAVAIRHLGKVLLGLIPIIYDTQRVIMIIAEDGTDFELMIDPQAQKAFQEKVQYNQKAVQRIFNPMVGKYEVQADIGPAYASKREEAFNAIIQILTQAPALTSILGDIMFKNADFPQADEAAARLRRMVPPQALGTGPSETEQALQLQLQQLQQALSKTLDDLASAKLKNKGHEERHQVDAYNAETDRWKVLADHIMDQKDFRLAIAQLVQQTAQTNLDAAAKVDGPEGEGPTDPGNAPMEPQAQAHINAATGGGPPVAGAVKAPDGRWYLRDRTRSGKWLMVQ